MLKTPHYPKHQQHLKSFSSICVSFSPPHKSFSGIFFPVKNLFLIQKSRIKSFSYFYFYIIYALFCHFLGTSRHEMGFLNKLLTKIFFSCSRHKRIDIFTNLFLIFCDILKNLYRPAQQKCHLFLPLG